jgi:hypothetical protein
MANTILMNIKKGTNKLKIAKIGSFSGEINGNKYEAESKIATTIFIK